MAALLSPELTTPSPCCSPPQGAAAHPDPAAAGGGGHRRRAGSGVHAPSGAAERDAGTLNVAVHIRRGDVAAADAQRYLPNAHYLRILRAVLAAANNDGVAGGGGAAGGEEGGHGPIGGDSDKRPLPPFLRRTQKVHLHLFSEAASDESFEPLLALGRAAADKSLLPVAVSLHLGTDTVAAWGCFMQADILVMSKSSFSFVPALYRFRGVTIYTPFWHVPMRGWLLATLDGDGDSPMVELAENIAFGLRNISPR
jgi:hypothetical protein